VPHRLRWLPQDPRSRLFHDWTELSQPLDLPEAGNLLKQWRDPQNRIQGQIEAFLELLEENRFALEAIKSRLEHGDLMGTEGGALAKEMQIREILDENAQDILQKINDGKFDSKKSVSDLMDSLEERLRTSHSTTAYKDVHRIPVAHGDSNPIRKLSILEKIPTKVAGGRSFLSQHEIIPLLGTTLSSRIVKQLSKFYPTDGHEPRKFGKINRSMTYRAAIVRHNEVPPKDLSKDDLRVHPTEENTWILLLADFSTSMRDSLPETNLSKVDGALLSVLGLYYYFGQQNLIAGRSKFEMALFPITSDLASGMKSYYRIRTRQDIENLLRNARAQGYTPITDTVLDAVEWTEKLNIRDRELHLVIVTDGKPNVSSSRASKLKQPFLSRNLCDPAWRELSTVLWHLKNQKQPPWGITYIQIGSKTELSMFERHVRAYLDHITDPILLQAQEIGSLGARIAFEVQRDA